VLNLLIISAALGAGVLGVGLTLPQRAFIVAGAVVLAGGLQVGWLVVAMRRAGVRLWRGGRREPTVRQAGRRLMMQWGPTALGLAVFQLNALADKLIAMIFSGDAGEPMAAGSVIALGLASRLYEFPLGVFGIAVATAIFPALAAATADPVRLRALVQQGVRLTLFIGVPATVGLILVRQPLCRAIYDAAGRLDADAAMRIAAILLGYAPAVWAYALNHLLIRTFYAHQNTITPMKVSLAMVALNLPLNLLLIWPLGAAGLAASTAICAALQAAILARMLRRYVERPIDRPLARSVGAVLTATAIMAGVVLIVRQAMTEGLGLLPADRAEAIALLAAMVVAGIASYLALAKLMRMAELCWLLRRRTPAGRE
jgi:putative peptidoglycan lipid II flippase